jgi:hypothetical protein
VIGPIPLLFLGTIAAIGMVDISQVVQTRPLRIESAFPTALAHRVWPDVVTGSKTILPYLVEVQND